MNFWHVQPDGWLILQILVRKCDSKLKIQLDPSTYTVEHPLSPDILLWISDMFHRPTGWYFTGYLAGNVTVNLMIHFSPSTYTVVHPLSRDILVWISDMFHRPTGWYCSYWARNGIVSWKSHFGRAQVLSCVILWGRFQPRAHYFLDLCIEELLSLYQKSVHFYQRQKCLANSAQTIDTDFRMRENITLRP